MPRVLRGLRRCQFGQPESSSHALSGAGPAPVSTIVQPCEPARFSFVGSRVMRAAAAVGVVAALLAGVAVKQRVALDGRAEKLGGATSLFDLSAVGADGAAVPLATYRGAKALLVVNVASN